MFKKFFQPHKPPARESRTVYAQFLSERIYGTITLLAVTLNLYYSSTHITPIHAFSTVIAAALGLWAASLFAEYTAYHVVHNHVMPREKAIKYITTHWGILIGALPTIILLGIAWTGLVEVRTALLTSIIVACTVILLLIFYAAQTTADSKKVTLIAILSQAIVAAIIIGMQILGKD